MGKFEDLTGKKFGRLTVLCRAQDDTRYLKPHVMWHCICDCGNELDVKAFALKNGTTKSCGCYKKDVVTKRINEYNAKHNMTGTRLYNIWNGMKRRCNSASDYHYKWYGARGIRVCNEWLEFKPFMEWALNSGYSDELTIDRIDNNGNYEPSNCRWATAYDQLNNTSRNHYITINGETHTLSEWGRIYNISPITIYKRIRKYGWSETDAVTTPVRHAAQ